MNIRRLRLFDNKRTRTVVAVAVAVGVGGLLPAPARGAIDNLTPSTSSTVAGAPVVAGDQSVREGTFGASAPASGCTTAANNGAPGRTNFTLYKGTGTSTSDVSARPFNSAQDIAAPATFVWKNFRFSSGAYHYRTSTQSRNQTGSCALGAAVTVRTDPYYVNLANAGKIVDIVGAGNAGTTATVSAKLVDGSHGDQVVTASGQPTTLMANRPYTIAGFPFSVGNNGSNASSLDTLTGTGSNNFLYTNSIAGFTPANMADGTSAEFYNRLRMTVDNATTPKTLIVECKGVTNKVALLAGLGITDTFTGFYGCTAFDQTGVLDSQTTITEGHDPAVLTFDLGDGMTASAPVDRVTGIAEVTIDTPTVDAGAGYPVTVTSASDGFLAPATANGAIDFKGGTVAEYDGDNDAFWNDAYDVSATVITELGQAPVNEGTVTFTRGTQVLANVPVANGVASGTLTAIDDPSAGQTIVATFNGTDLFNSSEDTEGFTTKPRLTTLDYTGASSANFGNDVTFSAQLTDTALGTPLPNQIVSFKAGTNDPVSAVTDANGVASTTVKAGDRVGSSTVVATFAGVTRYAGSSDSNGFATGFQYTFTDSILNPGFKVRLNPETQQMGLVKANGQESAIVNNAFQLSIFLPTDVAWPAAPGVPLPELPDEWNILNLPRLGDLIALLGAGTTVPATPVALPAGFPSIPVPFGASGASASSAPANTPQGSNGRLLGVIPTGGSASVPDLINGSMTIGDLVTSLSNARVPTSLSACMVLSGSTCERRFIVTVALVQSTRRSVVGVFDVKTGLFASLVLLNGKPIVAASLGTCAVDPTGCPALPSLPTGPPAAPTLPDPDSGGLIAALEALAVQVQAIPDLLAATPAPPVDQLGNSSASAAPPAGPAPTKGVGALVPTKGFVPWLP